MFIFLFRRIRDRQVQDRIREITSKIMRRRGEAPGNAFEEKRQAEFELREVKKTIKTIFTFVKVFFFSVKKT